MENISNVTFQGKGCFAKNRLSAAGNFDACNSEMVGVMANQTAPRCAANFALHDSICDRV